MKRTSIVAILVASLAFMQSCEKTETPVVQSSLVVNTVKDLVADTIVGLVNGQPVGAGKYTFFSLENNAIVPTSDSASSKWDIGFRGTSIITNGGNSGPGAGGGFVFVGIFDALKAVPTDSTFKRDNAPVSYAITSGSNKGWYSYDPVNNLINPIPGRVLVVRTGSGKYAKVEIVNYYKGGATPASSASDDDKLRKQRYYTFRYAFQANGGTTFQ